MMLDRPASVSRRPSGVSFSNPTTRSSLRAYLGIGVCLSLAVWLGLALTH